MADGEGPGFFERQRLKRNQEVQARLQRRDDEVSSLSLLSDKDLIVKSAARTSMSHPDHEMEMQRRLKDAVELLTGEIITSRKSADKLAGRVVFLNVLLVIMTAVLVALTIVLAVRS